MIYREHNNTHWTFESIGKLIYKFENSQNMTCRFELSCSDENKLNQIADWCASYGYKTKIDVSKNQVTIKKTSRKDIIKPKDIKEFEKICDELRSLMDRIREYEPTAHLYVTPETINLMIGCGEICNKYGNELKIAEKIILNLDCGDW